MLLLLSGVTGLIRGTAAAEAEEGGGYGRSVCPETLGPHAAAMVRTMSFDSERRRQSLNLTTVMIEG